MMSLSETPAEIPPTSLPAFASTPTAAKTRVQIHEAAPYVSALQRHAASDPLHVMVPGHGNSPEAGASHLAAVFGARVTELDVPLMLDGIDLGSASPLVQSLELAADAWGANRAWFLTNGASQGNRTAALAVRGLGERVLMQRSSHSSFTDGVLLAGLIPSFVAPQVDQVHGIAHGLTPAQLDEALERETAAGRPADSVYVVSPSYFGSTADVAGLAAVAHAHNAALIVDGAWGAHFGFHPQLPESPVRLGADVVISSTHKLAGSLTQSAMLLLGDGPLAQRLEPLIERAYSMTSSTSASAILMGSLDAARRALMTGNELISESIRSSDALRTLIRADDRFRVISDGFDRFADVVATDPLRIPIDVSRLQRSGHWVRERLIADHGVYVEMSTATSIVIVIGALATPDTCRIIQSLDAVATAALTEVQRELEAGVTTAAEAFPELPAAGTLRLLPRTAYFADSEVVVAADAVGRVSADTLAAYPPGIPNLIPGEEITTQTIAFLQAVAASPTGFVRGASDPLIETFRVVRDPVAAATTAG